MYSPFGGVAAFYFDVTTVTFTWERWYLYVVLVLLAARVFGIGLPVTFRWRRLRRPPSGFGFRRALFYRRRVRRMTRRIFMKLLADPEATRPIVEEVLRNNSDLEREWRERMERAIFRVLKTVPTLSVIGWSQTVRPGSRRVLFGLELWLVLSCYGRLRTWVYPFAFATAGHEAVHCSQQLATEGHDTRGVLEREWIAKSTAQGSGLGIWELRDIEQEAHDLFPLGYRLPAAVLLAVLCPPFLSLLLQVFGVMRK